MDRHDGKGCSPEGRKIGEDQDAIKENSFTEIEIDPDGELKLVIGKDKTIFRVDPNALRRHSSVFKVMLFGSFQEANSGPDWTVALPEDDPDAFKHLLNIIHANFDSIPNSVSMEELSRVLIISNKYDMTKCFNVWGRQWYGPHAKQLNLDKGRFSDSQAATIQLNIHHMWLANDLGLQEELSTAMGKLAMVLHVDQEGNLTYPRGNGKDAPKKIMDDIPELVDDKCLDELAFFRHRQISGQLGWLKAVWKRLVPDGDWNQIYYDDQDICNTCRYTILGCLASNLDINPFTQGLNMAQSPALLSIPKTDEYHWSIEDLQYQIDYIQSEIKYLSRCPHYSSKSSTGRNRSRTYNLVFDASVGTSLTDCRIQNATSWGLEIMETRYERRSKLEW